MIVILGSHSDITTKSFASIKGQQTVAFMSRDSLKLEDLEVVDPTIIVIGGMIANPEFYNVAMAKLNDDMGIVYGDYNTLQDGYSISRLNNSYRMGVPCVPLLGSLISPSFFYDVVASLKDLKSCDVSTKLNPSLDFFRDCCPQHWAEAAFSI
jgi:hypothetical protein